MSDDIVKITKPSQAKIISPRHREQSAAIQGKTKNEWIASSKAPRNDLEVGDDLLERIKSLHMLFIPTRPRERSVASHKWTAASGYSLLAETKFQL